ncbi:MAG: hypothetical protein WKG06_31615 [Segetibacter sp.]
MLLFAADYDDRTSEVQNKLNATGQFSAVDTIQAYVSRNTPNVAQLEQYDAVLGWSNGRGFNDPVTLGNNLATYINHGGGVVVACFAISNNNFISGGFANSTYQAIITGDYAYYTYTAGVRHTLGSVHLPSSSIND